MQRAAILARTRFGPLIRDVPGVARMCEEPTVAITTIGGESRVLPTQKQGAVVARKPIVVKITRLLRIN